MALPAGISRASRNGQNIFVSGATGTKTQSGNGIPAGTTAFALPVPYGLRKNATEFGFQIDIAGGTLSALTVSILGSIDGVNFYPIGLDITNTTAGLAFLSLSAIKFLAAAITTFTVATSAPAVTVSFSIPG